MDWAFKAAMLRAYSRGSHSVLTKLLTNENNVHVQTGSYVSYNNGTNTPSGSAITTSRNTFITALTYYCTLRKQGMAPQEAWNKLGMFGGDDGGQGHLIPGMAEKVFRLFNLRLKSEVVKRGEPVTFLGRVFLDPWNESTVNIADIPRQLRKLHLTTAGIDVPQSICLLRKAEAIMVTDPNTPILSHWARRVIDMYPKLSTQKYLNLLRGSDSWWVHYESRFTPPTKNDIPRVYALLAATLNKTVKEIMNLENFIALSTDEEFLAYDDDWMREEYVAPLDHVVGGLMVSATKTVEPTPPKPPAPPVRTETVKALFEDLEITLEKLDTKNVQHANSSNSEALPNDPSREYPRAVGLSNTKPLQEGPPAGGKGKNSGVHHARNVAPQRTDHREDPRGSRPVSRSRQRAATYRRPATVERVVDTVHSTRAGDNRTGARPNQRGRPGGNIATVAKPHSDRMSK